MIEKAMLYQLLQACTPYADRTAIVTQHGAIAWGDFLHIATQMQPRLAPYARRRIAVITEPTPECFGILVALDKFQADVFLFDPRLEWVNNLTRAADLGLEAIVRWNADDDELMVHAVGEPTEVNCSGSVTILTSGTTGKPKAARHSWESLARPVRRDADQQPQRWLLTYRPQLYAGLQVILQCFVNYGTLVTVPDDATPDDVVARLRDHGVQYCSATPSYWRRIILFANRDLWRDVLLKQITIGGELADQQLLDALCELFPRARIAHIYATTELGRCFSVTDGQAGFPSEWIDSDRFDDVRLSIHDGELYVRSMNRMQAYDQHRGVTTDSDRGEWVATGDLVEKHGDRVHFVGRRSDIINVGGNKVSPVEIENIIRLVPGVAEVRVFGQASSIAGQLVACEIVPNELVDAQDLRRMIQQTCQEKLAAHQRPRIINCVSNVATTQAGKTSRSQ